MRQRPRDLLNIDNCAAVFSMAEQVMEIRYKPTGATIGQIVNSIGWRWHVKWTDGEWHPFDPYTNGVEEIRWSDAANA